MKVDELLQYLKDNGEEIRKSILAGKYQPQPVRRVEIPKDNGRTRKLGIPTAVDRVIQQAIAQVLTPIYEPKFVETSYGFRPKRSAHDALKKCREYLNAGKVWTVDMDLEKFFDTVNQSKLMEILARDIKDGRVACRLCFAGQSTFQSFSDTMTTRKERRSDHEHPTHQCGRLLFPKPDAAGGNLPFWQVGTNTPSHKLNLGDDESTVTTLQGLRRCETHGRCRCSDGR